MSITCLCGYEMQELKRTTPTSLVQCPVCGRTQRREYGSIHDKLASMPTEAYTPDELGKMIGESLKLGKEAGLDPAKQLEAGRVHQKQLAEQQEQKRLAEERQAQLPSAEEHRHEMIAEPDVPRAPTASEIWAEIDRQVAVVSRIGYVAAISLTTRALDAMYSAAHWREEPKTKTVGHIQTRAGVVQVWRNDDPETMEGKDVMVWFKADQRHLPS